MTVDEYMKERVTHVEHENTEKSQAAFSSLKMTPQDIDLGVAE